jgi:hypothetical protein
MIFALIFDRLKGSKKLEGIMAEKSKQKKETKKAPQKSLKEKRKEKLEKKSK